MRAVHKLTILHVECCTYLTLSARAEEVCTVAVAGVCTTDTLGLEVSRRSVWGRQRKIRREGRETHVKNEELVLGGGGRAATIVGGE
jgi:hypothetical protein